MQEHNGWTGASSSKYCDIENQSIGCVYCSTYSRPILQELFSISTEHPNMS